MKTEHTGPPAIRTEQLVKWYGRARALDGLDLEVHQGEVFGFLGPNGAGKTTTIRLLLDLIRPTSGSVELFGQDPRAGGPELRRRVGYLPGDFAIEGRQTAREALRFLGNLRGGVPAGRIDALADRLGLDATRRIKDLSKGNRQKVGLVQAFMAEPDLLVLDEPTSGLDPLVRREFLAIVRESTKAGRTVFMSSHVLAEVQQAADRVGILRDGRIVAVERVEALRERAVHEVRIRFAAPVPAAAFESLPDVYGVRVDGAELTCRVKGRADALVKAAANYTVLSILSHEPDLSEYFLAYYDSQEPSRVA
jgi:ABC-2 type transport system ATP-binding protein